MRFGAYFIGLCMVIIAGSLGAVAYLALDLSPAESSAVAVTILSLLAAYNAFAARARERAALSHQITDLSRGTAELARQVGELGRRVMATETAVAQVGERTRTATDPLPAEIEVLSTLVEQLAESVAAHEVALLGTIASPPGTALFAPSGDGAPTVAESGAEAVGVSAAAPPNGGGGIAATGPSEMFPIIEAALEANRVNLYLQPIVTLPQRKVRYYEALTRLRTEEGALLLPADYLGDAEAGGLMPRLDNLMLFRCVQVMRRITAKNREVGVFCNIAGSTLVDAEFFPQLLEFLNANRALAPALLFEFSQTTLRAMGPIEHENLGQLVALGFRFSIDHVTDLQMEPRLLAEQGFRFVKVPAALLLNRSSPATSDIHTSDFSDLLRRYGIELIAEKIESEGTVVDLLDYDIRFGQGFLFAPPRPVRSEVLQGGAERAPLASSVQAKRNATSTAAVSSQPRQRGNEPTAQAGSAADGNAQGLLQLARAFSQRVVLTRDGS